MVKQYNTILVCLCGFFLSVVHVQASETLTIAVASSYYEKAQQQAHQFEQRYHVNVRLVFGSTGRLYNQIRQGAPFDVFIAANLQHPELLMQQKRGLGQKQVAQAYLGLQLGKTVTTKLSVLKQQHIRHIAMPNPKVAPFGQVAKKILQQHKLWQPLQSKLIYTQNALQARMMIEKKLVDAAFIPVQNPEYALATVPYIGVLLNRRLLSRRFFDYLGASGD